MRSASLSRGTEPMATRPCSKRGARRWTGPLICQLLGPVGSCPQKVRLCRYKKLEDLLEKSFSLVKMPSLQPVVMCVMKHLPKVRTPGQRAQGALCTAPSVGRRSEPWLRLAASHWGGFLSCRPKRGPRSPSRAETEAPRVVGLWDPWRLGKSRLYSAWLPASSGPESSHRCPCRWGWACGGLYWGTEAS